VQADIGVERGPAHLDDPMTRLSRLVGESTCQARLSKAGVGADQYRRGALAA
jgi:hypothetical protein